MISESLVNILDELRNNVGLYAKCQLYDILIKRQGINYDINGITGISYFYFLSFVTCDIDHSTILKYHI